MVFVGYFGDILGNGCFYRRDAEGTEEDGLQIRTIGLAIQERSRLAGLLHITTEVFAP